MKKAKIISKTNKNEKIEKKNELSELQKLTYIFIAIVGVFLLFYGIAYLKVNKKTVEDVSMVIQYDEILMSNLLNQKEDEYYAIVYNDKEDFEGSYFPFIQKYSAKEKALNFYRIDINNTFNSSFKNEFSELNSNNILEIKINKDVLFKIKDSKIIKSFEGEDNIKKELETIIK